MVGGSGHCLTYSFGVQVSHHGKIYRSVVVDAALFYNRNVNMFGFEC